MTRHISAQKIALIALFIVINIVGGHLALYTKLPIYLDTIGTLLGSAFFGPVGGLITGVLTIFIGFLIRSQYCNTIIGFFQYILCQVK